MSRARAWFAFLLLVPYCLLSVPSPASCAPAANWMWIWAADGYHAPETVYFRQRFRLPQVPVSARLLITADDGFSAYVNGMKKPIGQGNDWTTVQEFDVGKTLVKGENVLAVAGRNAGGAGGVLYKLIVTLPDGKTQTFFSDARVRFNRHPPPVPTWTAITLDDSRWPAAKEIAPAGGGIWKTLHGALMADPSHIVRLWDIRAASPGADPYARPRSIGERMLMSTSVSSPSDMQILAGAGFTLFQTDSDHLSTEEVAPNTWSWGAQSAANNAVHRLGMDWCYFPHEAFPPPWYRKTVPFTRIQCLEHQQPVEAFSPWDPTWPGFIDRGYQALANAFGKNNPVSALVVGIHGDYGEAGLLNGGRVEVPGQKEDWQQRFGNLHDHLGWWCNDPLARADFRAAMLKKYGSLEQINAVWKRAFKSSNEITYPAAPRPEARDEWLDFVEWYQDAVGHAIDLNLGAARKHFPDTLLMLPAGFSSEDPRGGNDNSLIPKLAAHYKAAVRSTHGAFKPFADNAATMFGRLGSACRFYHVPFWTEPPSELTADQEVQRIFESVSQGAAGYFDWAGNAGDYRDVYYRYGKFLRVEKPVVDVAMFYPAMAQKTRPDQGYAPLFAQACAYVRDIANFDIVDDRMVQDGCLSKYRVLALWEGTMADPETLDKIKAWVNDGGVLLAYDFGKVTDFHNDTSWFSDLFGYIQELPPAKVTERYVGKIPEQYRIRVGTPEAADFLGEGWLDTVMDGDVTRKWAGATATVRLPVDPEQKYTLVVRVVVPPEAANLKRHVLINGHEVGQLGSSGDVTYRFLVSDELLSDIPAGQDRNLATLTFVSETFHPAPAPSGAMDTQPLGVLVQSVQLVQEGSEEADAPPPPGAIRRELDLNNLSTKWARRYGKGLTIYFPATRKLLKGYIEVLRRAIYHLSSIDPTMRDALPIDDSLDGVYATLFTDKILYYNSKDKTVTKKVTIPAEDFAAWKNEIAVPAETSWTLTLEPHSIGAIYFTPEPQELLYECEKFTSIEPLKPLSDPDCSPGSGPTCVPLSKGASISTRILIETPGRYMIFTRCVHGTRPENVDVLVDGQPVPPINARAGQTVFSGAMDLTHGTHSLTLRARPGQDLRADFVLLTNDPTIAGYDFAVHTTPIE